MDDKAPKQPPGGVGRRSGIGLDQTMPDYDGPSEPQAPVRKPAKPAPSTDALPELSGAPPAGPPAAPPAQPAARAPAVVPRPAPPPIAPPPAPPPPPPAVFEDLEPYGGVMESPVEAAEAEPEPEEPPAPEPPKRSHTSRLSVRDLDMGGNASRGDNSGVKYKSDRARWW